ncbi:hypothetical protein G6F46_002502 [Rhizopus delemar]|nr:hypothetical protein G6F55_001343 [Rhizopus delemar]KAG1550317.1 hypothetical protein G6F51_002522 [Rhizopus arrhizus]KAG1505709.1 hypothetical protein G6F54_000124 [Rhizopus delemar]KAG1508287.1 hypothetical protein G6F53_008307 [Rhizopus delemar]KAG1523587.1 hypothetical protein G6F52_004899 [Rhizopus delemar]
MIDTSNQLITYSASLYNASPTLLPEQIANVITAIALTARLSIRCSSLLIEALLESVKYTKKFHELAASNTSNNTSLSVDRNGFLQVLDKYTNLGIYVVHHSLTLVELFALSGLHFTSQTIKSGFMAAEESVAIIDGIFGSNESSRAIASIITLVHRELVRDPDFKLAKIGKVAILSGLTKAITSFAILQNFTHSRTALQMGITDLWQGLVVEEEKDEVLQYQNKKDKDSSPEELPHPDIIHELEEILLNNHSSTHLPEKEQDEMALRYNECGEPYKLYEITTTTKRTTTKTTQIRPIDVQGTSTEKIYTKQIIEKTNEEQDEAFMAVIDSQSDLNYEQPIPGAWPEATDSCNQSQKRSGFRIMLASVSKILAKKKSERQENYDVIKAGYLDTTIEGPISTVTSTSTTLRSTFSTSSNIQHHDHQKPLPALPGTQTKPTSEHGSRQPPKRQKSWISVVSRKKSMSDLIQKSADIFLKKKIRSDPPPLPSLDHSVDYDNHKNKSSTSIKRSSSTNSSTSLSSIARTFKTTTYHHTSQPTPNSSSRSLIRSPSVSSRLCQQPTSSLDEEPRICNFPRKHIITNISHFIRYASAAYGESFMRILGIGDIPNVLPNSHHPNHHAFAHHTGISVSDILLSSYTDSSILSSISHSKLHALVHYVTVDHFAEAIVLTCRGTLGLSDVLTDLTCDYKEFVLPTDNLLYEEQKKKQTKSDSPRHYIAHGGMLEAAQLLAVQKGKVFEAIKRGLESYPNYGLVLCGHSLGAGVASLLSVLWSEERSHYVSRKQLSMVNRGDKLLNALKVSDMKRDASPFVTSELSGLPAGRPIHCYTFGSPCVMSLALSDYCGQGLVTSVVHGFDIVSSLSLGLLKDFKNIAVSLHEESHVADEILSRMVNHYQKKKANEITPEEEENEQWFWALIKTMRADMKAEKLFPPSTMYLIESVPQLAQHTQSRSYKDQGDTRESKHKVAHLVRFSLCKDIQVRFSEIVFSRTMFMDHSPNMYEKAIKLLHKGYFG